MKARIVQPECAELCRGCPNSCKQPAWMEVLRCPKIGYEHPDYEKIMAQARENDEIEHYIPEGKEPEKLWTNNQKTRVMQLVRGHCCNYSTNPDECLLLDGFPCVLETSLHMCCNYFRDCVLPLDKQLEAELTSDKDMKKCASCGKSFVPGSNRAKYCPKCSEHEARKKDAARKRRKREDLSAFRAKKIQYSCGFQDAKFER